MALLYFLGTAIGFFVYRGVNGLRNWRGPGESLTYVGSWPRRGCWPLGTGRAGGSRCGCGAAHIQGGGTEFPSGAVTLSCKGFPGFSLAVTAKSFWGSLF